MQDILVYFKQLNTPIKFIWIFLSAFSVLNHDVLGQKQIHACVSQHHRYGVGEGMCESMTLANDRLHFNANFQYLHALHDYTATSKYLLDKYFRNNCTKHSFAGLRVCSMSFQPHDIYAVDVQKIGFGCQSYSCNLIWILRAWRKVKDSKICPFLVNIMNR